jgi:MoaA/NifB/PqqE/SkfB family radical SAM enzyme
MQRYILREEHFGYTLFDKKRMKHTFVKKTDLDKELDKSSINLKDCDVWKANPKYLSKKIIYSPIRIYFELTAKCNLHCRTCFNSSGLAREDELTTKQVLKTLDGLRKDNVLDIRFSGGEVTQRDDWYEILKHAKSLGFSVSLNTNGVYSDEFVVEKLASLNLDQITFSIDGDEKWHNHIRGNGTYQKTAATIKDLSERGAHVRINTVLTQGSSDSLASILKLAGQYCEEVNFFYMRTIGRAENIKDSKLSFEGLHNFNQKIEPFKKKYPNLNILHGSQVTKMNSINNNHENYVGLKIGGPDGFTRFNLIPNGIMVPGGYVPYIKPEFCLDKIQDCNYSLLETWHNSKKLIEFREISLGIQEKCNACVEKNKRCPGANIEMEFYREHDPNNENPYCLF